ncbi:MAG: TraR/DksA family transcriptional regulator [Deltaproteobacteria bacterium]|nr:TraR/DksA family transcriptional regulator [Deltaproteobacteria bacterium]
MHARDLVSFKQRLQRRRLDLVRSRQAAERGVLEVREGRTDPEYEEGAQADHAEYLLNQLSDSQQKEIAQIDAALARMDARTYGICVECGGEIPPERLEALPYAMLDAECAGRLEEERVGVMRAPTL